MGQFIGRSYSTIEILREGQDEPLILKYLAVIYPTTGWFKIVQYNDKQEDKISNLVEQAWLCRYSRPTIIIHNSGNEFLGRAFRKYLIKNEYGITPRCATA